MPEISDGLLYFIKYPFLILIYLFLLFTLRIMVGSLSLRNIAKDQKTFAYIEDDNIEISQEQTVVNMPIPDNIATKKPFREPRENLGVPLETDPSRQAFSDASRSNNIRAGDMIPDSFDSQEPEAAQAPKLYGYIELLSGSIRGNQKKIFVNGSVTFGRSKNVDVFIKDELVSHRNAEIAITPKGPVLRDLGSTNGTFYNGRRLKEQALLQDGDIFSIGDAEFCWHK